MFIHPHTKFTVEFPGSAIRVGDALITEFNEVKTRTGILKLLTPTDCVQDRLAAFYHWNDRQGLEQAVWVALAQPVKLSEIEEWSKGEGKMAAFEIFKGLLRKAKAKK